jgi:hypothetical protein
MMPTRPSTSVFSAVMLIFISGLVRPFFKPSDEPPQVIALLRVATLGSFGEFDCCLCSSRYNIAPSHHER